MSGLGPGIHEFASSCRKELVDARPEAWHDDWGPSTRFSIAVDGRAGGVVDSAQPGLRLIAVGVEIVVEAAAGAGIDRDRRAPRRQRDVLHPDGVGNAVDALLVDVLV